jgi:hypothetical protein
VGVVVEPHGRDQDHQFEFGQGDRGRCFSHNVTICQDRAADLPSFERHRDSVAKGETEPGSPR